MAIQSPLEDANLETTEAAISRIVDDLVATSGADVALEALRRRYEMLEKALEFASSDRVDVLIDQQSQVIEATCQLPAIGAAGVAHKLAIWRAEADVASREMTRGEQLAFGAMQDAVRIAAVDHGDIPKP